MSDAYISKFVFQIVINITTGSEWASFDWNVHLELRVFGTRRERNLNCEFPMSTFL